MENLKVVDVNLDNVHKETFYCIKDIKKPGFESKRKWFEKRLKEGLRLKILKTESDKMIGFIEFIPASKAWRPVAGDDFMFIHCLYIYAKKNRNTGYGKLLINEAEMEAKRLNMSGVCVMTSDGSWITNKTIFEKYNFTQVDQRGRFELLSKKWNSKIEHPKLIDWTAKQRQYQGWHLIYADQCPWHEKSVFDLLNTAMDFGIDLKITKLETSEQAKNAPSGFGVFSLIYNGKLIDDHYLSTTRFKNILKKELAL
ncbi:GNAT family N-acetyltransferase [Winogradskyella tangerina]|uniref:GNAT family N-acetyltransferase n=1 Tax=Winogradskyella tangerina TaxID=2023240 RepID=UPI000DBE46C6|nr:GNAT family N-acetyltransferase [Winogradskyella tangerina]